MLTEDEDDEEATTEARGASETRGTERLSGVRALKTTGCEIFASGVLGLARAATDVLRARVLELEEGIADMVGGTSVEGEVTACCWMGFD